MHAPIYEQHPSSRYIRAIHVSASIGLGRLPIAQLPPSRLTLEGDLDLTASSTGLGTLGQLNYSTLTAG